MVTHPTTKWVQCRVTLLIKMKMQLLTQTLTGLNCHLSIITKLIIKKFTGLKTFVWLNSYIITRVFDQVIAYLTVGFIAFIM